MALKLDISAFSVAGIPFLGGSGLARFVVYVDQMMSGVITLTLLTTRPTCRYFRGPLSPESNNGLCMPENDMLG